MTVPAPDLVRLPPEAKVLIALLIVSAAPEVFTFVTIASLKPEVPKTIELNPEMAPVPPAPVATWARAPLVNVRVSPAPVIVAAAAEGVAELVPAPTRRELKTFAPAETTLAPAIVLTLSFVAPL